MDEAEELLRPNRSGEVHTLMASAPQGDQICTPTDAEHPYRVLVEAISEGAIILASDGTIMYCNRSFGALVGLPLDNVIGSSMHRFVVSEDVPRYNELLLQRGPSKGELRLSSGGITVPVGLSVHSSESGTQRSVCMLVTDITEHRPHRESSCADVPQRAEDVEAFEGDRRARTILESITDSYFEVDRSWRITEINDRAAAQISRTRDEVLGCSFWGLNPEGAIPELDAQYRKAMTDRVAIHVDERSATVPGKWFERHIYPTDNGIAVYFRDITPRKMAEEALKASEQQFRRYFDLGLIGMAITSPSKGCIEVNDELCRILGYEREELLLMSWAELTHPADLDADVIQFNRVMAAEIDGYSTEKRWIRKDGRIVHTMMAAKCVRRPDGSVEYFVGLVQDITQRKKDEAQRQDLVRRLMTAQEDERRRIALEMHDQFGQQLSALALKLVTLRRRSARRAKLSEELTQLEGIVRQLDIDLDLLISRLRPPALDDLGLIAALENYVREWSERFSVHVELQASGVAGAGLTDEIETTLYRVVLEALNNVAKHAHAMNAAILIDRGVARVSLIIEDDGVGFDVEQPLGPHQRFGLTGMRERASLLGGTFDIESKPGKGTTIALRVPLPRSEVTRE